MSYDSWKATEPDPCVPNDDQPEDNEPSDSSIERLLEDARLGDTVASVTLVEACERALDADTTAEDAESAKQYIRDYLNGPRHAP